MLIPRQNVATVHTATIHTAPAWELMHDRQLSLRRTSGTGPPFSSRYRWDGRGVPLRGAEADLEGAVQRSATRPWDERGIEMVCSTAQSPYLNVAYLLASRPFHRRATGLLNLDRSAQHIPTPR